MKISGTGTEIRSRGGKPGTGTEFLPRRFRGRAPARGFTLLEVLIAVSILGTAVVTLIGLHARNIGLAADAEQKTVAATLAGDVLALAQIDTELETGSRRGGFVAERRDADGVRRVYGGALSPGYVWMRDVMPTALPTLRQIRVRVTPVGEEDRVLAEVWAAVPNKVTLSPGAFPQ